MTILIGVVYTLLFLLFLYVSVVNFSRADAAAKRGNLAAVVWNGAFAFWMSYTAIKHILPDIVTSFSS